VSEIAELLGVTHQRAASGIAYTIFLVALGSYVVLWLALREGSK
jgi:hypothetical protein